MNAANDRDGVLDGVAETAGAIVDTREVDGVSDTHVQRGRQGPRGRAAAVDDLMRTTRSKCRRQPHSGAILNTTFTIGAEQHTANNAPTNDECATVSGETEVKDVPGQQQWSATTDDDIVSGEILTVVQTPLSDGTHTCVYNAGVIIPAGFKATSRDSEGGRVASYGLVPDSKFVADRGDINNDG